MTNQYGLIAIYKGKAFPVIYASLNYRVYGGSLEELTNLREFLLSRRPNDSTYVTIRLCDHDIPYLIIFGTAEFGFRITQPFHGLKRLINFTGPQEPVKFIIEAAMREVSARSYCV